jgi:hypothetical protein
MYFFFEEKITSPTRRGGTKRPGPEVCKMIVVLHKSGFTNAQIATRMKVMEKSVKWAIEQAGAEGKKDKDTRPAVALVS